MTWAQYSRRMSRLLRSSWSTASLGEVGGRSDSTSWPWIPSARMYPGVYADNHPDRPALIMAGSGATQTFAEFEANANRLAHLYRSVGLRRGDHVAMFVENNLRYCETLAAAERAGLYFTCITSYLTTEEVAYIVDDCDARLFITSAAKADVAVAAAALTPKVTTFLCIDTDTEIGPFRPYDDAIATFPAEPIEDEQLG